MKKDIIIAMPMYNIMPTKTTACLINTLYGLMREGHNPMFFHIDETLVYIARAKLSEKIVEYSKNNNVDYVVWIDSDQDEFSEKTILDLIDTYEKNKEYNMISAAYFTKDILPQRPTVVGMQIEDVKYQRIKGFKTEGLTEVDSVGFGMLIMPIDVLSTLLTLYKEDLFLPGRVNDQPQVLGEDIIFCYYAQREGYRMAISGDICIGHGFYSINKHIFNAFGV